MRVRILPPPDFISSTGIMIAPNAIKKMVARVPVLVESKTRDIVGEATVYPTGMADVLMVVGDVDFGVTDGTGENQAFTVDARVIRSHSFDGGIVVDELDPMSVSLKEVAHICGARRPDGARCDDRCGHQGDHDWPEERPDVLSIGDKMRMSPEFIHMLATGGDQILVEVQDIRQFDDGTKLLILKRADRDIWEKQL